MHAIIFEWRSLSPEGKTRVRELSDAYEALWHRAITDAVAARLIEGDPVLLRKFVLGGMNHMVRWYKPNGRMPPDAFIEGMLQAAFPSLLQPPTDYSGTRSRMPDKNSHRARRRRQC